MDRIMFSDVLRKLNEGQKLNDEEAMYYEETLLSDVYAKVEELRGYWMEVSGQCGLGKVEVYKDNERVGGYRLEDETEAMYDILGSITQVDLDKAYNEFVSRGTGWIIDEIDNVIERR